MSQEFDNPNCEMAMLIGLENCCRIGWPTTPTRRVRSWGRSTTMTLAVRALLRQEKGNTLPMAPP